MEINKRSTVVKRLCFLLYLLSDAIIGQAQLVARSDAEKLQLANEIATLMIEVARKAQLQEAAAIRLAQITSIYNSQDRTAWLG